VRLSLEAGVSSVEWAVHSQVLEKQNGTTDDINLQLQRLRQINPRHPNFFVDTTTNQAVLWEWMDVERS